MRKVKSTMKSLTAEEIRQISKNTLDIDVSDGVRYKRFTPGQYEEYGKQAFLLLRSNCPAGVCLDLCTDSDYIAVSYQVREKARNWLYFDCYVDGVLCCSAGQVPVGGGAGEMRCDLPNEKGASRRVTVYLPHLVELVLTGVGLSDNASVRATSPFEKNLLCLGDSITQGMSALRPSSAYPVQLARYFGMNLLNQGVGGYFFEQNSLDKGIAYQPDIVTVAYGTNDWTVCKTPGEYREKVRGYFKTLTDVFPEAQIFVITPVWRSDCADMRPIGGFPVVSDILREELRMYPQIGVIDGQTVMPHIPTLFNDGLHPNDEGFMHYALKLIQCISGNL